MAGKALPAWNPHRTNRKNGSAQRRHARYLDAKTARFTEWFKETKLNQSWFVFPAENQHECFTRQT
jgi:hypothetical protein